MYLSTLRSYIEAMGGRLEIIAQKLGRTYPGNSFSSTSGLTLPKAVCGLCAIPPTPGFLTLEPPRARVQAPAEVRPEWGLAPRGGSFPGGLP